ncbi:MAG: hypothetical protein KY444_10225 [Gemmatimonadetes bacterium]|nr:hypothetical protein [Gemmatimonadota bacterium]
MTSAETSQYASELRLFGADTVTGTSKSAASPAGISYGTTGRMRTPG